MTRLALLAVLLVLPVAVAQAPVATDYIRVVTAPAFQYRSDQAVVIPMQARIVHAGVPQGGLVHFEVHATNGSLFRVPGGQDDWRAGVQPYPHITDLNLGHLPVGLYRIVLHLWGGNLQRDWPVEFDVVYPPEPYAAAFLGTSSHEARFVFRALHGDNFTLTVFRDGADGSAVLQRLDSNATATLQVPYLPGESVKITVADSHGWQNAENRQLDATGAEAYPPYIWNPDYRQISNYQRHAWTQQLASGIVLVAGALLLVRLARRRPPGEVKPLA